MTSAAPVSAARVFAVVAILASLVAACGGTPPPSPGASAGDASTSPAASSSTAPSASPGGATDAPTASAAATPTTAPSTAPSTTPTPAPTPAPTAPPTPTPKPTPAPPLAEFPQTWSGSWTDPVTGGSGSLQLVLTGKGGDFGGTITMDGTACLGDGVLEGSYDGRDIAFSVTQRGTVVTFEGRARDERIEGTFQTDCDGMDGEWTVDRNAR